MLNHIFLTGICVMMLTGVVDAESNATSNHTITGRSNSTNTNSTRSLKTSSEIEFNNSTNTNSTRCLKTLSEIEQELSSTLPAMDGQLTNNYHDISRALFPPKKLPSLYIKVTIQFINDTGGHKTMLDKVKKFTWSESFTFVSVNYISLTAMKWFSLGTVYPQRRQSQLFLTLHPLCGGASTRNSFTDDNEMWQYILLQLQDIAILPNVSDPRVNTAQIVVSGHEGDTENPIEYPTISTEDGIKIAGPFLIMVTSFCITAIVSWIILNYISNNSKKKEQTNSNNLTEVPIRDDSEKEPDISKTEDPPSTIFVETILISSLVFFIIFFIISCVELGLILANKEPCKSPCTIFVVVNFIIPFLFLGLYIFIIMKRKQDEEQDEKQDEEQDEKQDEKQDGEKSMGILRRCDRTCVFPCCYFIVYHLMWVLCGGIVSDPTWAIPLFLCEGLAALTLVCAIYLYQKTTKTGTCDGWKILHLVLSVLIIWLGIITAMLSFSSSIGVSAESILEIIMVSVVLWMAKNSGILQHLEKKTKDEATL